MKSPLRIIIVTPVYNDWPSVEQLLRELSDVNSMSSNWTIVKIIAVNDGSNEIIEDNMPSSSIPLTILNLNNNMGHQRAISVGLSFVEDKLSEIDGIIVMDCDGEDRPEDIEKLIEALIENNSKKIIFAKRKKRNDGIVFKFFYNIYRLIFLALTSQKLDFGNFSCIPGSLLSNVVSIPELWNHFSGGIIKSKIPYLSVNTDKGNRFSGRSKMNFQNLVLHGLSSISIYLDVVSVRLLFASFISASMATLGLLIILYMVLFTDFIVPYWFSGLALVLLIILVLVILITFLTLLFQLNQKAIVNFPPKTFYKKFILSINNIESLSDKTH